MAGRTTRTLMVQGVSSDAGKSLVVTALCRWLARQGVRVAPFKAQNMSNNARVVRGGEVGTAQWLQALAARAEPDVRMNPVLLKPESDTRSQVVLNGRVDRALTDQAWRGRSRLLWPHIATAFDSLCNDFDVVVIEGAGSPAETNLWADDVTNMPVAELADAPVLLVADIDRGGAFAHLYGTWALLPPEWQRRVEGFLLNKFRGDVALLDPAPADLEAATGVPTIGVLPMLEHALPDEEGPSLLPGRSDGPDVVVVCGPYASNLDELVPLQRVARVRFARGGMSLAEADLVVLPGSKHVAGDLVWLRETGLADQVIAASAAGVAILGVCGGLQMLGRRVVDPAGVEGEAEGLGLLDAVTTYRASKRVAPVTVAFDPLPPPWEWLSGRTIEGYEIRHGETNAASSLCRALPDGLGFVAGNVLGVYVHGVFEDADVVRAFTGVTPPALDRVFDELADALDTFVDVRWLRERTKTDG